MSIPLSLQRCCASLSFRSIMHGGGLVLVVHVGHAAVGGVHSRTPMLRMGPAISPGSIVLFGFGCSVGEN